MMATTLNSSISNSAILDSAILLKTLTQTHSFWLILDDGSHLEFCHHGFSHLHKRKLHSFILTQLDDGTQLEFCYLGFSHLHKKNFTCSFWLNLMMATILNSSIFNSAILDSAILLKTLTQTSSIWLKLIHSQSTWWYQTSWILPSSFQTLPYWIQTPCYLLSDSLKNTLPPLWPWLKLIQSD